MRAFERARLTWLLAAEAYRSGAYKVPEGMLETLRPLFDRPDLLSKILADLNFVEAAVAEKAAVVEALHVPDYMRVVLTERHWLEGALAEKALVMRALDEEHGKRAKLEAFHAQFEAFSSASGPAARLPAGAEDLRPQLADATAGTPFDRHYLYHPAWAARVLARTRPAEHVDIGSILHFATLVSAFIPVRFYDFRPAPVELDGLVSGSADLTALPFADGSIASLSCMHVLEHIGLGRYGDPLDPDGDLKAIRELVRVLAPGGDLLIATPVGRPRVAFNAHRVYDHESFAGAFEPLDLVEFALIEEHGDRGPIPATAEAVRAEDYGCGCFWFRKPVSEPPHPADRSDPPAAT